jgi:hypothetical protein
MNSQIKQWNAEGCIQAKQLLSEEDAKGFAQAIREEMMVFGSIDDKDDYMVDNAVSIAKAETTDILLEMLTPAVEEYVGTRLLPTYSYARIYQPGQVLKAHLDRESCEISATVTLDYEGAPWEIMMADPCSEHAAQLSMEGYHDNTIHVNNVKTICMNRGDAVIYRGTEKVHWREEYKTGNWQVQVFLHWVDANGPNRHLVHDGRPGLSHHLPKQLRGCYFMTTSLCFDNVEQGIRNLKEMEERMIAAVATINKHAYKFNIDHFNSASINLFEPGYDYTGDQNIHGGRQQKYAAIVPLEHVKLSLTSASKHEPYDVAPGTIIILPSFITYSMKRQDELEHDIVAFELQGYGPPFK